MELKPASTENSDLVTCSLCLRVRHGRAWIEAEAAIQELRSYELATAPRLQPGICNVCERALFERRARAEEPVAA